MKKVLIKKKKVSSCGERMRQPFSDVGELELLQEKELFVSK